MKRNNHELDGLLQSESGLWSAVLLDILNEIEAPADQASYDQAKKIITDPGSGCLPFIAAALDLDTSELQKKVTRYLQKKRIKI